MSSTVSIKDVAARAGVSVGTVSNVLNRPERVAEETRTRVQLAIIALGFVRNEPARQLRAGRSRTIGLLVLDAANPFFADVSRGAEEAAANAGLAVILCNSGQDAAKESAYLNLMAEQRVQGLLLTPVDADPVRLAKLVERGMPVVLLDRRAEGAGMCSVSVDDISGGELAVSHLLEMGHERIAFIGGPTTIAQVKDRLQGARNALARAGRDPESLVSIITTSMTVAAGRGAGERLGGLPVKRRPTAAFCGNDLLALGLLAGDDPAGPRRTERRRDRRLRRHRVRGRRGCSSYVRAATAAPAGQDCRRSPPRRDPRPAKPHPSADRVRARSRCPRLDTVKDRGRHARSQR